MTIGFHSEENKQPEGQHRVKLEVEEIEKLEEPLSYPEVVCNSRHSFVI